MKKITPEETKELEEYLYSKLSKEQIETFEKKKEQTTKSFVEDLERAYGIDRVVLNLKVVKNERTTTDVNFTYEQLRSSEEFAIRDSNFPMVTVEAIVKVIKGEKDITVTIERYQSFYVMNDQQVSIYPHVLFDSKEIYVFKERTTEPKVETIIYSI